MKIKLLAILLLFNANIILGARLKKEVKVALELGDIKTLTALLQDPKNFDGTSKSGNTPLIIAIKADKPEVVELLLKYDFIKKTINTENGLTPLGWAKLMRDETLKGILIKNGAK